VEICAVRGGFTREINVWLNMKGSDNAFEDHGEMVLIPKNRQFF